MWIATVSAPGRAHVWVYMYVYIYNYISVLGLTLRTCVLIIINV